MKDNIKPVIRYCGGKRSLLPYIAKLLPDNISKYCEPFIGGGALLFYLKPQIAYINDSDPELINMYKIIKNNVEELIEDLKQHENSKEYFFRIRDIDKGEEYNKLSNIEKASRKIFIHRTCFRGMYKLNKSRKCIASYSKSKVDIVNENMLRAVSNYFIKNDIKISCDDFENIKPEHDCFVYLDPPYENPYLSTFYRTKFNKDDQVRLKKYCDFLTNLGIKFLLSHSDTGFITNLYKSYGISRLESYRPLKKNRASKELLIKNY